MFDDVPRRYSRQPGVLYNGDQTREVKFSQEPLGWFESREFHLRDFICGSLPSRIDEHCCSGTARPRRSAWKRNIIAPFPEAAWLLARRILISDSCVCRQDFRPA